MKPEDNWSRLATSGGKRWTAATDKKGNRVETRTGDPRPFPFLDAIIAFFIALGHSKVTWAIRSFDNVGIGDIPALLTGRTLAWVNKNLTILTIAIDGVKLEWSDRIGPFGFKPGTKLMKRLSALIWQSDIYVTGIKVRILEPDEPTPRWDPNVITIRFIDTEDPVADGISYLSRRRFRWLLAEAEKRGVDISEYSKEMNWNFRFVFFLGLLKGNWLVTAKGHKAQADIVTSKKLNVKKEMFTTDGLGYLVSYPESHNGFGRVWLDRQTRGHFWGWLFDGLTVVSWLKEWFVALIEEIKTGDIPRYMLGSAQKYLDDEQTTMASYTRRMIEWSRSEILTTFDSIGMLCAVAKGVELTVNPSSRKEDARKLPVKYAVRTLLRSEYDLKMAGYRMPTLSAGQAFYCPEIKALIIPDADYDRVVRILGGADKDDHVVIHYRFCSVSGKLMMIIVRNPIGAIDGLFRGRWTKASEFWVAEAHPSSLSDIKEHYGSLDGVPSIDLTARPFMSDEPTFPADDLFVPVGIPIAPYSPDYVADVLVAAQMANIIYGVHANLVLFAMMYDIPLTFFGHEEVFVDVCQQAPNDPDIAAIDRINRTHALEIIRFLNESDVEVDRLDLKRIGKFLKEVAEEEDIVMDAKTTNKGVSSRLFDAHNRQMIAFSQEMRTLLDVAIARFTRRFGGRDLSKMKTRVEGESKPALLLAYDTMVNNLNPASASDYDAISNLVALQLDMESMDERDRMTHIWDTLSWKARYLEVRPQGWHSMVKNDDRDLLGLGLLDYYIDFLEAVATKEKGDS